MKALVLLLLLVLLVGVGWMALSFLGAGPPIHEPTEVEAATPPAPVEVEPPPRAEPAVAIATPTITEERPRPASTDLAPTMEGPTGKILGAIMAPGGGGPLEGAQIDLLRGPSIGMDIPGLQEPTGFITTAGLDGVFRFDGVPPAEDYVLMASHPLYGDTQVGPLVLRSGQTLEVGTIKLKPGTGVHGFVSGAGRALEGAVVTLTNNVANLMLQNGGRANRDPIELTVTTGADGTYAFEAVPIKNFEVTVDAEGFGRQTRSAQSFFGGSNRNQEINFELTPAARIMGLVVDENGRPLVEAEVSALITNAAYRSDQTSHTGADGSFALDGLSEGHYFVRATLAGFSEGSRQRVAAGTTDLTIKLLPQGVVSGTVIDEKTGEPLESFQLTALRFLNGRNPARTKTTRSFRGSGGHFELQGLDPNQYIVEATARGYAPSVSEVFVVKRGETITGIVVPVNKGGSIRGVVLDSDRKPVVGAIVSLNDNNFKWNPVHDLLNKMARVSPVGKKRRTDENGAFRMGLIVPDTYQIGVQHPDYASFELNDIEIQKDVDMDLGDLFVAKGSTIEGTVYDEAGAALAGATVQANSTDGDILTVRCEQDGHYIIRGMRPGEYTLTISDFPAEESDSFLHKILRTRTSAQTVTVRANDTFTLDLQLTAPD